MPRFNNLIHSPDFRRWSNFNRQIFPIVKKSPYISQVISNLMAFCSPCRQRILPSIMCRTISRVLRAKNRGALLGQTIHELVEIIKPVSGTTLNEFLKLGKLTGNFEQLNPQKILVGEREMFLICHIHNGNLICECEPGQTTDDNITLQKIMSTALAVIQSSATFSKLLSRVASLVKEITGYVSGY